MNDLSTNNPVKLKYVRLVRIFLWTLGGWPDELDGEKGKLIPKFLRMFLPTQAIIAIVGEMYYCAYYFNVINLYDKGHCFIVCILTIMTFSRSILPSVPRYNNILIDFFTKYHLIHFRNKNEYCAEMYNKIDKLCYFFSLGLMFMMVAGMLLFNASPWYLNYKAGVFSGNIQENYTVLYSVNHKYPGLDPYDHFVTFTTYNMYGSYACSTAICAIDLLLYIVVFNMIGHILMLRNDLASMPQAKREYKIRFNVGGENREATFHYYDDDENEIARKSLANCIDYHKMIIKAMEDLSEFFGPMLALNYLSHLINCCLLLLECSQIDPAAMLRFGPLTMIIFAQLIQMSMTFEVVDTASEKLNDSVYLIPWENMNTSNRRTACILLNRVQTPIRVKAMGLAAVGVTTMSGILKTTFSYFMFLRSKI